MSQVFKDFDLSSVWESDSWADENYKEARLPLKFWLP